MQQAVHDRDDEYGLSQARGGEINTQPRMCVKGAACARSAVDIWGSASATQGTLSSQGKGLSSKIEPLSEAAERPRVHGSFVVEEIRHISYLTKIRLSCQ